MKIIIAAIVLGCLGLLLGLIIGLCNKFLQIDGNSYIDEVYELLPQINCGMCGNPSCIVMAEAILEKGIPVSNCRPCKMEKREVIDRIVEKYKEELQK